jgi:hypothetical protein
VTLASDAIDDEREREEPEDGVEIDDERETEEPEDGVEKLLVTTSLVILAINAGSNWGVDGGCAWGGARGPAAWGGRGTDTRMLADCSC